MRRINLKSKLNSNLFLLTLVSMFCFIIPLRAEDLTVATEVSTTNEVKDATRTVISTSGPAKFNSYWLDNPPRLVVEFQTRNIISKIDNEVMVNQGAIKRITSSYLGEDKNKTLKSLTFELTQKLPYKIWQELDTIILDIQTPQDASVFPEDGKEVFAKNESKVVMIQRLEAMDDTLKKVSQNQPSSETSEVMAKSPKVSSVRDTQTNILNKISNRTKRKSPMGVMTFWFIGLALISGLGLLLWLFWRRYKLILDKNVAAQEIEKLKSQVAEKNKLLDQEKIIRKAIEDASKTNEKEFEQLKLESQREARLLEQEEKARKAKEEELLLKEKECAQVKDSLEFLKEVLVEKGIAKKLTAPEKEGELWIAGKSAERREFPRLDLSKDYNRTIILRIESQDKSKSIKSFANNIGLGGLCFETRREFKEKESINLRLFFFGDKVPMMKIKARVMWERTDLPINYYGISFVSLEEKDKAQLNHYIESKIGRG